MATGVDRGPVVQSPPCTTLLILPDSNKQYRSQILFFRASFDSSVRLATSATLQNGKPEA